MFLFLVGTFFKKIVVINSNIGKTNKVKDLDLTGNSQDIETVHFNKEALMKRI